jgi:hypothetical protein
LGSSPPHAGTQGPRRAAGIAAIFCVLAAFFQLYLGLRSGGVPPEFVLFGTLALIFGALWWRWRLTTSQ